MLPIARVKRNVKWIGIGLLGLLVFWPLLGALLSGLLSVAGVPVGGRHGRSSVSSYGS